MKRIIDRIGRRKRQIGTDSVLSPLPIRTYPQH